MVCSTFQICVNFNWFAVPWSCSQMCIVEKKENPYMMSRLIKYCIVCVFIQSFLIINDTLSQTKWMPIHYGKTNHQDDDTVIRSYWLNIGCHILAQWRHIWSPIGACKQENTLNVLNCDHLEMWCSSNLKENLFNHINHYKCLHYYHQLLIYAKI